MKHGSSWQAASGQFHWRQRRAGVDSAGGGQDGGGGTSTALRTRHAAGWGRGDVGPPLIDRGYSGEPPREARAALAGRLRARLPEIERAVFSRVQALTDQSDDDDPSYLIGLRRAVSAAISHGIEGVELGLDRPETVPTAVMSQARRAARAKVSIDIALRRFALGGRLLAGFIFDEGGDIPSAVVHEILADQGLEVDRLMARVAAEYEDEVRRLTRSSAERIAARIAELVEGDSPFAPLDMAFDFDLWHVGLIFRGAHGERFARSLARQFGYRALLADRGEEVWAWLSSPHESAVADLERLLTKEMPPDLVAAFGEARAGMDGWRLSHREARVALQIMLRRPRRLTRGRDVILLAGILRNDTLVRSLLDAYLVPLEANGLATQTLIDTLRAYFSVGGNAAAAAASLGVTRHTVQRRIKTVEQTLGRPIHSCYSELVVALEVVDLLGQK